MEVILQDNSTNYEQLKYEHKILIERYKQLLQLSSVEHSACLNLQFDYERLELENQQCQSRLKSTFRTSKTTYYQAYDQYNDILKYIAKQKNRYGKPIGVVTASKIIERGGPEFDMYYHGFRLSIIKTKNRKQNRN